MALDKKFWDGKRWNGHAAFHTISHTHISCYWPAEGRDTCDIMAVECKDGRWYVEDNWGGDANGASGVWNPFDPSDEGPRFFETEEAAIRHAVYVVASVSGVSEAELLTHYLSDD
jgi:hypothetical protein